MSLIVTFYACIKYALIVINKGYFKLWHVILASVHATLFWVLQCYQQVALGSFFESYWDSFYKMNTLCINKY